MNLLYKGTLTSLITLALTGCPFDGDTGPNGSNGTDGSDGLDGINCWDLNQNREQDNNEDINSDGEWNVEDCKPRALATISQNKNVALNHEALCSAFANLGQYPNGCPSINHLVPTGNLTALDIMWNDGSGNGVSCALPPNNGNLHLKKQFGEYYWIVDGGYIANTTTVDYIDELQNNTCYNTCLNDSDCIASYAQVKDVSHSLIFECNHFYHSDTVGNWEHGCGGVELKDCASRTGALSVEQRWSALCP